MSEKNTLTFQAEEVEANDMYKLLIGSIVPRPIAWVSSKSENNTLNLAPFSFFTVASPSPPTLAISIAPAQNKGNKDTLTNIQDTKEYVINIVSEELGNEMYVSSQAWSSHIDEFEKAGLTPKESDIISPPRVDESPISFEIELEQVLPVGISSLVLGRVLRVHVKRNIYIESFKTDIEQWKPLARLAGDYASISKPFRLPKE
ncbi:flavin reductase family protein [Salibacterium aidingense]|uniref:flavin reductase family protein n=1 Tax=Salibacterium aidingense TaxID=384933 RepID=UPI00040FC554|nr:flavin reductase family protein [Salibacterium aidingense]